ncbi:DUF1700 domain-containing protein [Microbacterium sp. STN6]|uniref:HAAS signaling domain-containing protein n=1 Tax=Microbacterium sp. STN6 TaxID=2995588 RepID=UPI002260B000|nr:DUF1700 domain-containing protein [Microbacterium sp. STN6]MCX7521644.1 DUF1700 domain-containing protein [Microbacterium sp. STN6]
MKSSINDSRARRYLDELDADLLDLPVRDRREIVESVVEHISIAMSSGHPVEEVLQKLGDPLTVSEEAHSRNASGWRRKSSIFYEIAVTTLLLVGGLLLGVGWIVGLVMLWASKSRTLLNKIACTLIWPGGLLGAWLFLGIPVRSEGHFYFGADAYSVHPAPPTSVWTLLFITAAYAIPLLVQLTFLARSLRGARTSAAGGRH